MGDPIGKAWEKGFNPLTGRKLGNPAWVKGKSGNPAGKPKGLLNKDKVKDRLKEKGRSPLDQLVRLADKLELAGKDVDAAEIWLKIQEYVEPKKKPVETAPEKPLTPEQSKENVEEMLQLLEEAENGGSEEVSSDTDGLHSGKPEVQAETSPEDNPQEPSGE
jgi:hypothetical protein